MTVRSRASESARYRDDQDRGQAVDRIAALLGSWRLGHRGHTDDRGPHPILMGPLRPIIPGSARVTGLLAAVARAMQRYQSRPRIVYCSGAELVPAGQFCPNLPAPHGTGLGPVRRCKVMRPEGGYGTQAAAPARRWRPDKGACILRYGELLRTYPFGSATRVTLAAVLRGGAFNS